MLQKIMVDKGPKLTNQVFSYSQESHNCRFENGPTRIMQIEAQTQSMIL